MDIELKISRRSVCLGIVAAYVRGSAEDASAIWFRLDVLVIHLWVSHEWGGTMRQKKQEDTPAICFDPDNHPAECRCATNNTHNQANHTTINEFPVQTITRAYTPPDDQTTGLAEEYDTQRED